MAAMAVTLDSLNINTTTATTGYFVMEPVDWGGKAVSDIVNSGQYRLEDMDAVLAAGRVLRQVTIPLRIIGSSSDDLDSKISAVNVKLSKASRFSTVNLVVTPQGSSATSTFKVVGGSLVDTNNWGKRADSHYRVDYQLVVEALPFVYGAKQTYGSSGSPLLAATATPTTFTVTPTQNGDVLSDVTIIFLPTVNPCKTVMVSCISGLTGWTEVLDVTAFTHGGGASFATVTNAKYLGGGAVGVTLSAANTITNGALFSAGLPHASIPTQTPIRIFAIVDDLTVTAANRGLNQFRVRVQSNQNAIGDWCVCPPGAFSGASHFSQVVDMGTFTMPPGPISDQTSYGGTSTVQFDLQTTNATPTQLIFDSVLLVPDLTSLVAEFPSGSAGTSTATRVENDLLFDTFGQSQNVNVTGAHVRSLGTTDYAIYGSGTVMASLTGDATYETIKAWCEVTPRYLGLAPA